MSSSLCIEPTASIKAEQDCTEVISVNHSSRESTESSDTPITPTLNHRAAPAAVIVESIARKRKSSPLTEQPLGHQNGTLETASANKLARVVANSGVGLVNKGLVPSLGAHQAHLQNAATGLGGILVAGLPSQIQHSPITQNGSTHLLQQAALSNHLIRGATPTIGPQILPAPQQNLLAVQQQQQLQATQSTAATQLFLANHTAAGALPSTIQQEQQNLQVQTAAAAAHTFINSAGKPTTMSIQQKDTTYTKIFVGGLPYHTTDESLRDYFTVFGEIEEAVVITDRQTGKSRGYGFVTMIDKASAESACKDPNPVIDGRKANVNLAYIGAKPRVMQTTVGYRPIPQAYLPTNQYSGVPAVYAQYPQHAAAYVTHNGVLIPAHVPSQPTSPFIDYTGAYMAQLSGAAYATDVAATAGSASFGSTQLHHQATGLAHTSVPAGATQLLAAAPAQAGITAGGYQGLAGYHPTAASVAAAYAAAAANNQIHQAPPLASTPTPVTYAHLTAQLQQHAAERY